MPHIHLRTSANLQENVDIRDVLDRLALELARQESIEPSAVKAYHTLHTNWAMGSASPEGFAHLSVSLLDGRPESLLAAIGEALYSVLKDSFKESAALGEVSLTLEVREMARERYWKSG